MPAKKITRREALKALTALAGATALSGLPSRWEIPFVEVGALPAHAQISEPPPTVSNLVVTIYEMGSLGCEEQGYVYPVDFEFDYADPASGIEAGAIIRFYDGEALAFIADFWASDFLEGSTPSAGSVLIPYCLDYQPVNPGVQIVSLVSGLSSNIAYATPVQGGSDGGERCPARRMPG